MSSLGPKALLRAVAKNGDRAFSRFFEGLQQRKLVITRCHICGTCHFPPRPFCPDCFDQEVQFVEHPGRGRIYAYTAMADQSSGGEPITFAMVELEGVEGRFFTRIDAPYEEMTIGMEVEADYLEREGIVLPCFRPMGKGSIT